MIDCELVRNITVVALVLFAGCGYWLYRENDTGGSWIDWLNMTYRKTNGKDFY